MDGSEDLEHLGLVEGLLVEQPQHRLVEDVAIGGQDLEGFVVGRLDQPAHLFVDLRRDLFAVVALVAHVPAEEDLTGLLAELQGTQPIAHPELGHHRPRSGGGLLDVVGRAGRGVVEHQLLSRPATERVGQGVQQLRLGLAVGVLFRQHHGVPECAAPGQDRDLVHRVDVGQGVRHQSVTGLVVGGHLLLLVAHHPGAPLRACHHPVDGLLEGRPADHPLVAPGGQQRGLVDHVGEVGTGEPGGTAGDDLQVDVWA